MKRPRKLPVERSRRFCQALDADSSGRSTMPWWTSIHSAAGRLGVSYDDAAELAIECAEAGLVSHDQSQHTHEERRAAVKPHSVTLNESGRQLARGKRR